MKATSRSSRKMRQPERRLQPRCRGVDATHAEDGAGARSAELVRSGLAAYNAGPELVDQELLRDRTPRFSNFMMCCVRSSSWSSGRFPLRLRTESTCRDLHE